MSDATASLRHKIKSAGDLQSVVRTMKSLAASSIVQYERSERALRDYARTVELGLSVCFRGVSATRTHRLAKPTAPMRSSLAPIRDWWANSMIWWPIMP
jgi:F-type H+-transporting ATPase subunit gamma